MHSQLSLDLLSPTDSRFRKWKQASASIAAVLFSHRSYYKYATRLCECGDYLKFRQTEDRLKLVHANFCKLRICPMCSWRRRLFWLNQLNQAFFNYDRKCEQENTGYKTLMLTLTCKNTPLVDLRSSIKTMTEAWKKFTCHNRYNYYPKGHKFPLLGHFKTLEVTITLPNTPEPDKDYYRLFAHPHYHCLLVVPKDYNKRSPNYLTQREISQVWKKSLGVDYTPIVDIRTASLKQRQEVCKYLVKPINYQLEREKQMNRNPDFYFGKNIPDSEYKSIIIGVMEQLKNVRAVSTGGIIKKLIGSVRKENLFDVDQPEPTDYIHITGQSNHSQKDKSLPDLVFLWDRGQDQYILR